MRASVFHGAYDIRPEDVPVPTTDQDEALIKISYAGVCGSDLTIYVGKHRRVRPPVILGHEFTGEIVEIKASNTELRPGDRVVVEPLLSCGVCYACKGGAYHVCERLRLIGVDVDGAFAEYVKVPIDRIYKVPDGLSMEDSALVEPVAVAVHAVRQSRLKLSDRAVVMGAGPIGLLVSQVARVVASVPVDLVEISPFRLELARKLGFDPIDAGTMDVQKEVLRRTAGRGADVLFDAAGVATTAMQHGALARIRGQVVMVAIPKEPLSVDLPSYAFKELALVGCRVYDADDYRAAISLVAGGRIDVRSLISHILPLEQAKEGLELVKKAENSMKVLLRP